MTHHVLLWISGVCFGAWLMKTAMEGNDES